MKFKIEENKNFNPITINLVVETREELIELVTRLDISSDGIVKYFDNSYGMKRESDFFGDLWDKLDKIYEDTK